MRELGIESANSKVKVVLVEVICPEAWVRDPFGTQQYRVHLDKEPLPAYRLERNVEALAAAPHVQLKVEAPR